MRPSDSLSTLLLPPKRPGRMHLVCYLRQGSNVFETYWITIRGAEAMNNNYRLLDLTVYGRQETWETGRAASRKGTLWRPYVSMVVPPEGRLLR